MSFSVNCAVPAKKIVVIGAGLAGLVASYKLTQAGHASECRDPDVTDTTMEWPVTLT